MHTWTNEPARLNSSVPRIANCSLPSAPASRPVSEDTSRKWERAARDQTYMCNQAAAFSRFLIKVQDSMASQLKIIKSAISKGKSASKLHEAADDLDYLVTFNRSITQAMARTMQDLSDGVFINVANLTLTCRDSYLDFLKNRIKQDTFMALRTVPLHMSALFPDHIIVKAEEEIRHHEDKCNPGISRKAPRYHPYSQGGKQRQQESDQKSANPCVNPKVVTILREGYTLPFQSRPNLTRSPNVISCYVNPHRNLYLLEALHQLLTKNAVEPVTTQKSLDFYNRLFLVPKPNCRWRPILDLSTLNQFLRTESFKMETPETIRTSLQIGEWVTSVDFKDAYFHIPIQSQSRKYMRFQIQNKSYQFKALPFGLSTAPMEFTVVAKEVKFIALQKGIRIHQYLGDWLVRARSHQICLQHTQTLVPLCQELGWLVNNDKSELVPKQVFNFVGYYFDLREGRVRPTQERYPTNQNKSPHVRSGMPGPETYVTDRFTYCYRETSAPRSSAHETNSMAFEKQLESTGITREGDSHTQVSPPPSAMVAGGKQYAPRSTITPATTCSANLYRHIKRRLGPHLSEHTARGNWSIPESKLHINYLEVKALKEFQDLCWSKTVLIATDTTVVTYINKEVGG